MVIIPDGQRMFLRHSHETLCKLAHEEYCKAGVTGTFCDIISATLNIEECVIQESDDVEFANILCVQRAKILPQFGFRKKFPEQA